MCRYDLPVLIMEMYTRGYALTGLAHPKHWSSPAGPFFQRMGAIKASPLAAYRALRSGKQVLLFPGTAPVALCRAGHPCDFSCPWQYAAKCRSIVRAGGAKEVAKLRDQKYQLLWKDGDFIRLAARCDALIVPFAAVGGDDAFDLFMDTKEVR
jgi:hypothetical protein